MQHEMSRAKAFHLCMRIFHTLSDYMKTMILWVLLMLSLLPVSGMDAEEGSQHFYTLNTRNGLSDNCVLQMTQLPDGRMVIATQKGVNIYDCTDFQFKAINEKDYRALNDYNGQTHLYVDAQKRLWVKKWRKVCCLDLKTFRIVDHSLADILHLSGEEPVNNLFADSHGMVWVVRNHQLKRTDRNDGILLPAQCGELQDLITSGDTLFLFFADGSLHAYGRDDFRSLFVRRAYDRSMSDKWASTSLVQSGENGMFYQIRTGNAGAVFLVFDPFEQTFQKRFECPYTLHTLTLSASSRHAIISSPKGYLVFPLDQPLARPHQITNLKLPDGTELTTGVNTIYCDKQGGIWLGTYREGLLYTSPHLGLFDTTPLQMDLYPILTRIFMGGEPVRQGCKYDGKIMQPLIASYTDSIELPPGENRIGFQFSTMNYVNPRDTRYRYRLNGGKWTIATVKGESASVDGNGLLYVTFNGLAPGDYVLEVKATTPGAVWKENSRKVFFRIVPSPWLSTKAWCTYVFLFLGTFAGIALLAYRQHKRRENEHALMRCIQELRERCQVLEEQQTTFSAGNETATVVQDENRGTDGKNPEGAMSDAERLFLQKAMECIERRISDSEYGVEELAKDLCMERTGLYKKLKAMTNTSPVVFIRSVRLHHASELMGTNRMSLTDIAFATGFSSPSYFAKCFKAEYGMTPTEYLQNQKVDTK